MFASESKSRGLGVSDQWDDLGVFERLSLILANAQVFLDHHLISPSELFVAEAMNNNEWEYIMDREDQPVFATLHIKKDCEAQHYRNKLKAALRAVFL